jgi:hypothetical protein
LSVETPRKFINAISGINDTMARYDLAGMMAAPTELAVELAGTTDACRGRFRFRMGRTTIGRGDDCNVQIYSEDVSRHHATIEIVGDLVTILDAGSFNGTFLNGRRIEEARLRDGDVLSLGPRLRFVTVIQAPGPRVPPPIQAPANDTLVDLMADPARLSSAMVELLEGERRQLALLLQISMRYLSSVGDDPVDTLFDILSRVIRFDAAFVSEARPGRGEFRAHPGGARLTPAEYARLARECAHGRVVQDETGAAITLGAFAVGSRALLPLDGGGCLGLLARDAHAYTHDMEFLGILARIHAAAAAVRAKAR